MDGIRVSLVAPRISPKLTVIKYFIAFLIAVPCCHGARTVTSTKPFDLKGRKKAPYSSTPE